MKKLSVIIVGCFLAGCMGSSLRSTVKENGQPKCGVAEFKIGSQSSFNSAVEDMAEFCKGQHFSVVKTERYSQVESVPAHPIRFDHTVPETMRMWQDVVVEYGLIFFNCGDDYEDRLGFDYKFER